MSGTTRLIEGPQHYLHVRENAALLNKCHHSPPESDSHGSVVRKQGT